jgi:hypothetical protein
MFEIPTSPTSWDSWTDISSEPDFELSLIGSPKDNGIGLFDFDSFYSDQLEASSPPSLVMSLEASSEESAEQDVLVPFEGAEV